MKYLALCLLCKNEENYIQDWLDYHHYGIGVGSFLIYNNESTDHTLERITKWKNKHPECEVFTFNIPGCPVQKLAYERCIEAFKESYTWIGFIDTDEYIVTRNGILLEKVLKKYEGYSALCLHWLIFGANGHTHYSPKPDVERFTMREDKVNPHIKSIVNPREVKRYLTPHKFTTKGLSVDERRVPLGQHESTPEGGTAKIIWVNHYATRSRDECIKRRSSIRRADTGELRNALEFFNTHDHNDVQDLRAFSIWKGSVSR